MKKRMLAPSILCSVVLLSNCTITTAPPVSNAGYYTEYNTGYSGYTVGYTYGAGNDDIGDGTYLGYGGWASSFYAPGYRYGYWPLAYSRR